MSLTNPVAISCDTTSCSPQAHQTRKNQHNTRSAQNVRNNSHRSRASCSWSRNSIQLKNAGLSSISARRAGLSLIYFVFFQSTHSLPHCLTSISTVKEHSRLSAGGDDSIADGPHSLGPFIAVEDTLLLRIHSLRRSQSDKTPLPLLPSLPIFRRALSSFGRPVRYSNKHLTQWAVQVEDVTKTSGQNRNGISLYELSVIVFVSTV